MSIIGPQETDDYRDYNLLVPVLKPKGKKEEKRVVDVAETVRKCSQMGVCGTDRVAVEVDRPPPARHSSS